MSDSCGNRHRIVLRTNHKRLPRHDFLSEGNVDPRSGFIAQVRLSNISDNAHDFTAAGAESSHLDKPADWIFVWPVKMSERFIYDRDVRRILRVVLRKIPPRAQGDLHHVKIIVGNDARVSLGLLRGTPEWSTVNLETDIPDATTNRQRKRRTGRIHSRQGLNPGE